MTTLITAATTVSELADHWLAHLRADGRLESTTINEYERVLRRLVVPDLGNSRLEELSTIHIDSVLATLGTQSHNRQRKAKVVTGAMLNFAVEAGAVTSNPVRGSLSISRPRTDPPALTQGELDKVRSAVRAWMTADRPGPKSSGDMAEIIELMLATGARIGEALALRWSDIDILVALRDGKAPDYSRGFASRPQLRGSAELAGTEYNDGWGAHCYAPGKDAASNDVSFRRWTCAEGLACQIAGKTSRMGMCFVRGR